jgi:hypothetical protein
MPLLSFTTKASKRRPYGSFKRIHIIDYIKQCYDALHVMGGLAIADDIKSLINGIR